MKKKKLNLNKFHFTLNGQTYLTYEKYMLMASKNRTDISSIEKSIEEEISKFKEKKSEK